MKTLSAFFVFLLSANLLLAQQNDEDIHTALLEDSSLQEEYMPFDASIFASTSILDDAIALNTLLSEEELKGILAKYDISYETDLHKHLFLKDLKQRQSNADTSMPNIIDQTTMGSTGNNINNIVSGISRFLVDRAKKEVNESFFTLMYKEMNKMTELQFLFPESYYLLQHVQENSLQINLEQLRLKFENDIAKLPFNLYAAKDMIDAAKFPYFAKINEYLNKNSQGKWLDFSLYLMLQNHKQSSVLSILSAFSNAKQSISLQEHLIHENKVAQLNLFNSIKFLDLIAYSMKNSTAINNFSLQNFYKIEAAIYSTTTFKNYLGLLLAKSQMQPFELKFYKGDMASISLKDAIESFYSDSNAIEKLQQLFMDVYAVVSCSAANNSSVSVINYQTVKEPKKYHECYTCLKEGVLLLNRHIAFGNLLGQSFDIEEQILLQHIMPAFDLMSHIKNKNYNLALNDASILLGSIAKDKKDLSTFLAKFTKYGTLIATVAEAQNSDEVKAAIEAAVLPVGSSRIKRHSRYSLSLNAYVGGFYGKAFYKENSNNIINNQNINTFGLMAPIGVSFNIGSLGFKKKSSLSLTAQIVDLGALVNFYAKNGDGASLPAETKIHFSDILAPGVQLSYSLGDSPFSIIAGFQYVANLTRLPEFSNNSFIPAAYRAQIGLVVDIPLFNLKVWEK